MNIFRYCISTEYRNGWRYY